MTVVGAMVLVAAAVLVAWLIVHVARQRDRYSEALDEIGRVLGTGACDQADCEGCKWEMQEAARIATRALFRPKAVDRLWHGVTVTASDGLTAYLAWHCVDDRAPAPSPRPGGFRSRTRVARALRTLALTQAAIPVVTRFASSIAGAYVQAWKGGRA